MNFIFSILWINLILIFFYSIGNQLSKIFKINFDSKVNIIIGYTVFLLISYNLFFFLKLRHDIIIIIYIFLSFSTVLCIKKYIKDFFLSKENILLNILVIVFFLKFFLYGEQFYIFRGNYWDSSNYLSSAILFNKYNYSEILNNNIPNIFFEFQNWNYVIKSRPLVNYLLSLFLNIDQSYFISYFVFKIFLLVLTFLSLIIFCENTFKYINYNSILIIGVVYIFSFWNLYVFEIDALSHYASIPILLLVIQYLLAAFEKKSKKTDFILLSIFSAGLFLIYPEIFIIPSLIFLILLIDNFFLVFKKKFFYFFLSLFIFILFTLTSYETNYEFLLTSQINQAISSNDWWGYFGSFILGRDNLVIDENFINLLSLKLQENISFTETFKFIYNEHIRSEFYFIFVNILPSIFGLYFYTPGKFENSFIFYFNFVSVIFILIYLIYISYVNINFILKKKDIRNKVIYFVFSILLLTMFFIFNKSFWTIIKLYTYIGILIYLFFVFDLNKKKLNYVFAVLTSLFFIYKFSIFNNGIGRYDSFPSILNKNLKSQINWNEAINNDLYECNKINVNDENYIIKAYLNLKLLDINRFEQKNKNCKIILNNYRFILKDDQ
jgi:hypothetical protein